MFLLSHRVWFVIKAAKSTMNEMWNVHFYWRPCSPAHNMLYNDILSRRWNHGTAAWTCWQCLSRLVAMRWKYLLAERWLLRKVCVFLGQLTWWRSVQQRIFKLNLIVYQINNLLFDWQLLLCRQLLCNKSELFGTIALHFHQLSPHPVYYGLVFQIRLKVQPLFHLMLRYIASFRGKNRQVT